MKLKLIRKKQNAFAKFNNDVTKGSNYYVFSKTFLCPFVDEKSGSYKISFKDDEEKRYLEKELGFEEKTFDKMSKFWIDYEIRLDSNTTIFDTENLSDLLNIRVLQGMINVAKSIKESNESPYCEYLLINEEFEVEQKNKKRSLSDEAVILFHKMTDEDKEDYAYLKGIDPSRVSKIKIETIICDERDSNPQLFNLTVKDKKIKEKVFISKLVQKGILKKIHDTYEYNDEYIAGSSDEMLSIITDPKKNNLLVSLKKQLVQE